jgi:hypothetical protein
MCRPALSQDRGVHDPIRKVPFAHCRVHERHLLALAGELDLESRERLVAYGRRPPDVAADVEDYGRLRGRPVVVMMMLMTVGAHG